jgi:hypothetical protein
VRGGNRLSEEYQVKLNHVAVLGRTQTYVALLIYIFPLSGLLFKSPSSLSSLVDSFTGPILLQIAPAYQASLRYPLTSRSIKFSSELQAIFHLSRSTLTRDEPRSVAPRSRWRMQNEYAGRRPSAWGVRHLNRRSPQTVPPPNLLSITSNYFVPFLHFV